MTSTLNEELVAQYIYRGCALGKFPDWYADKMIITKSVTNLEHPNNRTQEAFKNLIKRLVSWFLVDEV